MQTITPSNGALLREWVSTGKRLFSWGEVLKFWIQTQVGKAGLGFGLGGEWDVFVGVPGTPQTHKAAAQKRRVEGASDQGSPG